MSLVSRATPLNQKGKRGLVTARTASCSATRSCRVQSDSVIPSHDVTSLVCTVADRVSDRVVFLTKLPPHWAIL